jgi:hypothetical protein
MENTTATTGSTKLTDWSFTYTHANTAHMPCDEVDALMLGVALRDAPDATAEIVGHRHTPTGRHAVTIHRTREL